MQSQGRLHSKEAHTDGRTDAVRVMRVKGASVKKKCARLQRTVSWCKPAKCCKILCLLWDKPSADTVLGKMSAVTRKKRQDKTCESVEWLKSARLARMRYLFVQGKWIQKKKKETAADELIKQQAKAAGQQMSMKMFVRSNWYAFCFKNGIIVKANRPNV
jgi:hypothetical protein